MSSLGKPVWDLGHEEIEFIIVVIIYSCMLINVLLTSTHLRNSAASLLSFVVPANGMILQANTINTNNIATYNGK